MVGELKLRVVHCLIADPRASIEDIRIVRSHGQGFEQCKNFLAKHPDWTPEPAASTATAVGSIAREGALRVAAIAGLAAAKSHGLKVLQEGIEDNPLNYTRFVIISRRRGSNGEAPTPPGMELTTSETGAAKATLVFSVQDEPGNLFACLKIMADRGINLSKLESRPIQGKPWEYLFYVDVTLPEDPASFQEAIKELKTHTKEFYYLGSYRAAL
jgi:3-deoxy-7-phosphoheptulonate synthase